MSRPPPPAESELRNTIRDLRAARGNMTQQQLADHVGVSRQTIVAVEAGRYAPSLVLAFRIARVFGRSVEQVFTFDG
jgi:putative transcriptional regulator